MIVFGTSVTDSEAYELCALPGIRRASEPDSVVIAHHTAGSVFHNYNVLLDKAAEHEDLEALVLLHQDVEIADSDFPIKVREALRDPDVAILGCVGAVGVRSIAWWQGAVTWAAMTHRYPEYGGGDFPAMAWRPQEAPPYAATGEVDSLDGLVLVLSPWAVRELRFDESLGKLHGYDFDICMQAKAAGKKVVTVDFRVIHHHSLELINDPENWTQTYIRLVEKWQHLFPSNGADPGQHALRAEAEAACARALMVSHQMKHQAAYRQLERVKRELEITREELQAAKREVAAAKPEPPSETSSNGQGAAAVPGGMKLALDYAIEELAIESFASLEIGPACGQVAFYTIAKPGVREGALIDAGFARSGDSILSAVELAAEHPGMRVLEGTVSEPATVAELAQVDAILICDVLVRLVDPDWDELLERYAPATSAFVIANPQWDRGDETIRLIELGEEEYLKSVPPWPGTHGLFNRLDKWDSTQARRHRDGSTVFQWGITDADLVAKMSELGFSLDRDWTLNRPPHTDGFVNKAFVFRHQ
ncbi:MAG TPA: glycosyltransferase [Thermoleophilaceae bacterium]